MLRLHNFKEKNNITINLNTLILNKNILELVYESNLQGTKSWEQIEIDNINFYSTKDTQKSNGSSKNHYKNSNLNNLTLKPLEIRSFKLKLKQEKLSKIDIGKGIWNLKEEF